MTALLDPTVSEQIIAFADLRGYHRQICSKLGPEELFAFLADYYSLARRSLEGSEGRIVKFIGDSILLIFPAPDARRAIDTLKLLKAEADSFLSDRKYDSLLCIKAHVGAIASGMIGDGEDARFDICGLAVNETALLPNGEWSLSDELQKRCPPGELARL